MSAWLSTPAGREAALRVDPALLRLTDLSLSDGSGPAALEPALAALAPEGAQSVDAFLAGMERPDAESLRRFSSLIRRAEPFATEAIKAFGESVRGHGTDPAGVSAEFARRRGWDLYGPAAAEALRSVAGEWLLGRAQEQARRLAPEHADQEVASAEPGARASLLAPAAPEPRPLASPTGEAAPPVPTKASPPSKGGDLKLRAATAAALIPSLLGLIYAGGAAFALLAVAISTLSVWEYASLLDKGGKPVDRAAAVLLGFVLAAVPAFGLPLAWALPAGVALVFVRELFSSDRSPERAALTLAGALLLGWMPAHLALVRGFEPHGLALTLMMFVSAWVMDTAAYLVGRAFGKHKIAPVLSPKKTWEGTLAGFAAAVLAVLAFWAAVPGLMPLPLALAAGAVMGTVGQLGGYVGSFIKRSVGAKDSGKLLPGHGGVMDRFDTFILSASVVYLLLKAFS